MDDDAVVTLLRLDVDGVSSNTLYNLRVTLAEINTEGVSTSRLNNFVNDLDRLESADQDIDGVDELVERVAVTDNPSGFVGPASEAGYAANNINTITSVRYDVDTPPAGRPGDIDTLENIDGRLIGSEIKNSGRKVDRRGIGSIDAGYSQLVEQGAVDEYQFVFRELSDPDLREYLENNNIPYTVMDEG